jgi:hypothetical protein
MNTSCIPWCASLASALLLGSLGLGCAGADDQTWIDESPSAELGDEPALGDSLALEAHGALDGPGVSDDIGRAQQPIIGYRSDYAGSIAPPAMSWGTWQQSVYCNEGTYAIGFAQKVESGQGRGDDTALNTVALSCAASAGGPLTEWLDSHPGHFGTWGSEPICNGFITGARMRIEGNQGRGDDTAANSVEMSCSDGASIATDNGGPWGSWTDWSFCGPSEKVCGLRVRVEGPQGGGDDTGMNALELFCCH